MAQTERLQFDIYARLREDGFSKAGKAALAADEDVKQLADRLDKLDAKTAEAQVKLKGDKEALAQLDKLIAKKLEVGRNVTSEVTTKGVAKSIAELSALEVELDKLGAKSEDATSSIGTGGLAGPAGMGALIGAGVALSPIIATVATGVAGFGAAAYGSIGPIMKAAQATGGLGANMAKLDPEQRKLATSILGLGKQYDAFQKALEPQVLSVFGKGIQIAGHLMQDVQPVAQATGKALGQMLGAIDKEFQSGTWTKFFAFMAKTAGPDIQLITTNFTDLMQVLPGILMDLQPLARGFLTLTDDVFKVIGALDKMHVLLPLVGAAAGFFVAGPIGAAIGGLAGLTTQVISTSKHVSGLPPQFEKVGHSVYALTPQLARFGTSAEGAANASDLTAKGVKVLGQQATAAKPPVFNLTAALAALTNAQQKNVDELLAEQGNLLGWQQAIQSATKQLNSNTAGLKGNSANALANKQAVLASTQAAEQFAESQSKAGGNIALASKVIQQQIHWLEVHAGKSKFARDEIHALRLEEEQLRNIRQQIRVTGSGSWSVAELAGGKPIGGGNRIRTAQGAFITGGVPNRDSVPIMAMPGELVVPTKMVSAGLVDHLRGMIPGFASGGVVGNFSGSVGGMTKWLATESAATLRAIDASVAAATAAGIRSAQAASAGGGTAGPGGGTVAQNKALARQLMPSWGSGAEWANWDALWTRESGWSQYAYNPSGATGIPQALPHTKMPRAAWLPSQGGSANVHAQETWGIGYIQGRYGDPIGAMGHENRYGWYAKGGPVGGKAAPMDPQKKKWLAQLERDVKVLHEDQKHARERRKVLRQAVEIDQLWFLTHPNVRPHGIGYDEHERALRNDERILSRFNRRESDKEKELTAKIRILRDLTGYPRAKKYGGPGTPGGGAGDGSGGGDTGGGTTTPSPPPAPPPIPPPPEPQWMVDAGLGGSAAPSYPAQVMGGGMAYPEPVTYGGGTGWGGYGGSRTSADLAAVIAAVQAMHQGVVGAVNRVAPGTARGFDRSMNSMVAGVAGRFG